MSHDWKVGDVAEWQEFEPFRRGVVERIEIGIFVRWLDGGGEKWVAKNGCSHVSPLQLAEEHLAALEAQEQAAYERTSAAREAYRAANEAHHDLIHATAAASREVTRLRIELARGDGRVVEAGETP